ncbi:hypothetical protein [Streptomyces naphthomycinicus]|uniref:hypothetical protein n=1 Tax=Streptomyces naphthomycinicus TaxID=2872625 RepID=UPI001CEC7DF9|nr:hypothetical protein [Streptomyces sp. TML10]
MARRALAATAALTVVGLVAGCSGSDAKKEYDVPRAFCGVSLDPGLTSPFLPSGKKIKVGQTRPVPSRKNCRADVDGHWALALNLEWWEEDVSSTLVASGNPQLRKAGLSPDGGFYSGTGAVVLVKGCENPGHAKQLLYTSVQAGDPDLGDTAAMKKLATAFTQAVGKSDECS